MKRILCFIVLIFGFLLCNIVLAHTVAEKSKLIESIVDQAVLPVMKKYNVPGMAIALTVNGKDYYYNYGIDSKDKRRAVTRRTIFEVGSVTKTFTAVLLAYFVEKGALSLDDRLKKYLPEYSNSAIGNASLLQLITHTTGLDNERPKWMRAKRDLERYLLNWQPKHKIGTKWIYSNQGIYLAGEASARVANDDYMRLVDKVIIKPLGLLSTYFNVPRHAYIHYAKGYRKGYYKRTSKTMLMPGAYGLKSTSKDMLRYLKANMQMLSIPKDLQAAIVATHTAYFKTRYLTQDMAWEQFDYPLPLMQFFKSNTKSVLTAHAIDPPGAPRNDVWINKTGSSGGFRAYVAFVPIKKAGIVILSNGRYSPKPRRVLGYEILSQVLGLAVH